MDQSKEDICNLALSHVASGEEIQNLDTDKGQEAQACRRFYDLCIQGTLRDFPSWPFATRITSLALVTTQPNQEWSYSYRYPSDCLFAKRILSGLRMDTEGSRIPYRLIGDNAGQLILCGIDSAQFEYTAYVDDPTLYPPDFILASSLRLAIYIAPRLTAGDQFKLRATAVQLYTAELERAKVNAANEMQSDLNPQSEFIRARG